MSFYTRKLNEGEGFTGVRVSNMIGNSGKAVNNQFVITGNNTITFQSYQTVICVYYQSNNTLYVNSDYCHYSVTTSNYFNKFKKCYLPEKYQIVYLNDVQFNQQIA